MYDCHFHRNLLADFFFQVIFYIVIWNVFAKVYSGSMTSLTGVSRVQVNISFAHSGPNMSDCQPDRQVSSRNGLFMAFVFLQV